MPGSEIKKIVKIFEDETGAKKEIDGDVTFLTMSHKIPIINKSAVIAYSDKDFLIRLINS